MANLKTDSPLSTRIARSFLHFLNSVELSDGADDEVLQVAKECLAEVFKIDQSSIDSQSNCDSLVDIFSSREESGRCIGNNGVSDSEAPTSSSGKDARVQSSDKDRTREPPHSLGKDELFGQFFGALENIHYFRRMPDGNDDQIELDRATYLFHNAVQEMQTTGRQTFDQKMLAETFKTQGNKAMQSKLYTEAIELYTFAIALCEGNAVYYCNRAAAYTQIQRYDEAVRDCLKSIEINPNYSKAYSRLGFVYYAQGKYRDAIDKGFSKALQLEPNNDSVKENIRVAEMKLKDEQHRAGSDQSSTSTSHGQSSHQHEGRPRSSSTSAPPFSMPFNMNGFPPDITSMVMNITGNMFQDGPEGASQAGPHNEPGVRVDGNVNFDVNELPEEISGAFRSMMGMFSGASPNGNQQDNNNGRPAPS
ncbi:small glutamine-rich tetratricopeptide repeat-containing protein-like isoform X1 [Salvia splendens]|uniref:small glutamine-rich tetratricopeptide repeat-containing protein-like isoform X1 n=1 Tax=Salvia splendens TaxID=180675 RepID=UPI0011049E62|nr:small glutamine-rich tetratricopeptide repeat-containing protein-like isoform X1 [Salvia splendens]